MALSNIKFNIASDGLNRLSQVIEKTAGLITTGVSVVDGVTIGKSYQIFSLQDAQQMGITEGGNNDFAYQQLRAYFSISNSPLWFMLVSDGTAQESVLTNNYATQLINDSRGEIRGLFVSKLATGNETIANGLDADAHNAVIKAQELANHFGLSQMPLRVFIGGNAFTGVPSELLNYSEADYPNVRMWLSNTDGSSSAELGLLAGRFTTVPSQRSLARVKDGPLEDQEAYLTTGDSVESLTGAWDYMDSLGYMFFRSFARRSGFYVSNDQGLTKKESDFRVGPNGCVIDEAQIIAYNTLIEELSDEIEISTNGTIHPAIVKSWQAKVDNQIKGQMVRTKKISGVKTYINENQSVLQTNELIVELRIQPVGYAGTIIVNLGFTLNLEN